MFDYQATTKQTNKITHKGSFDISKSHFKQNQTLNIRPDQRDGENYPGARKNEPNLQCNFLHR